MHDVILTQCLYVTDVAGRVTVAPSGIVTACSEEHIELTCTTTAAGTSLHARSRSDVNNSSIGKLHNNYTIVQSAPRNNN